MHVSGQENTRRLLLIKVQWGGINNPNNLPKQGTDGVCIVHWTTTRMDKDSSHLSRQATDEDSSGIPVVRRGFDSPSV